MRLRNHSDQDAWRHFESVYLGVVTRVAIRYGMQPADAADLGQDVMMRVSQNIHRFDPGKNQARFRTWLGTLIRSVVVDRYRSKPKDVASGLTEVQDLLSALPAEHSGERPESSSSSLNPQWNSTLGAEEQIEIFRWAANRIRNEYTESSWLAFWRTTVENHGVKQVAEELGRSVGAIYTSRSRIMRRLREEVKRFDDQAFGQDHFVSLDASSEQPMRELAERDKPVEGAAVEEAAVEEAMERLP